MPAIVAETNAGIVLVFFIRADKRSATNENLSPRCLGSHRRLPVDPRQGTPEHVLTVIDQLVEEVDKARKS